MLTLQHSIYEGNETTPILTHVFYGETREAALEILHIHAQYDEFLRAALTTKNFKGIPLRVTEAWTEG